MSAAASFQTASYPISKFFGPQSNRKFVYLGLFSNLTFENLGVLRNKNDIMSNEFLELRSVFNSSWIQTQCNQSKVRLSNSFVTGIPSVNTTPTSVATSIILSPQDGEEWWTDQYSVTVDGSGTSFTFSVADTSTNFDWLLFPNQFFVSNGEGFATADEVTVVAGAPGFLNITVEGVVPALTPSSVRNVKAFGFTMATIDEWTGGTILSGTSTNVSIKLTANSIEQGY